MHNFGERLLAHPANQPLLAYLSQGKEGTQWAANPSCSPENVKQPYLSLGTHPDSVERAWDFLGKRLPGDCRWVVWGRPVLVAHASAEIFLFATGTIYALRLASPEFVLASAAEYRQHHTFGNRQVLDVSEFGSTWVIGKWKTEETEWIVPASEYSTPV